MKQKIVIKANINCDKCKSKALQTVAKTSPGIISVEIKGDEVVVKGDGVDCTALASALRKKLGWAEIMSVDPEKEKEEEDEPPPPPPPYLYPPLAYVCECQDPNPCSIV